MVKLQEFRDRRKSVKNILRLIVFCLFVFMNDDENDAASLITDVIISKLAQPSRGTALYWSRLIVKGNDIFSS